MFSGVACLFLICSRCVGEIVGVGLGSYRLFSGRREGGSNPRLLPPETNRRLRFPRLHDSGECAVARESVRFCAPTGLVIPPEVVQLVWAVLEERSATEREVKLARWLLVSTLRGSHEG